jgi:hypothetical protein
LIRASKDSPGEIPIPWKFENLFFNDEYLESNLQCSQKMKNAFCNRPLVNCLLAHWWKTDCYALATGNSYINGRPRPLKIHRLHFY